VTSVAHPLPRGVLLRGVGRRLREWVPALLVFALGIAAWQWLVPALGIQKFLLPRFSSVANTFWNDRSALWSEGWVTFKEALGGFAIGCGAAIVVALALARWRPLGNALMPYAVAANAVPIIAFAPITNAWFGALNPASKMAIAAVLCFFPVLINTLRGLTSVRPSSIELMHSYAAGEIEIFRRVRIPSSLPYVFTGLKVASVLAMIGAIVGDYFGGSSQTLGIQILSSTQIFDFETAWAAIMVASILGIAFYGVIAVAERVVLRWNPSLTGPRQE
jgi:NitT/TauT family transport system permease protein